MPKPLKKRKPRDENQMAFAAVERIIQLGESETAQPFDAQYRAHMAALGSRGGKVSGAKRMEMPEAKRREIALKAARARWAKPRPTRPQR